MAGLLIKIQHKYVQRKKKKDGNDYVLIYHGESVV